MPTVYLNGRFLPQEEACVSVTDRGFLFGDGVYEVIPAFGGRLFRLQHHLERLQNSLDGILLENPLSNQQWQTVLDELLKQNRDPAAGNTDQAVYLQVTRGCAPTRDHRFPAEVKPTVYAVSNPIPDVDPAIAQQGLPAVTLDDNRWSRCNIKAITLLPNVLLRQQATEAGAAEAILIRDGLVIEGSASNVFLVSDGRLVTPPKSPQLLPGITRDLVLELAQQHGLPFAEHDIPENRLFDADEIWVTSSTREIVPITSLNGEPVGEGKPGPLWKTMAGYYRAYKTAIRQGKAG